MRLEYAPVTRNSLATDYVGFLDFTFFKSLLISIFFGGYLSPVWKLRMEWYRLSEWSLISLKCHVFLQWEPDSSCVCNLLCFMFSCLSDTLCEMYPVAAVLITVCAWILYSHSCSLVKVRILATCTPCCDCDISSCEWLSYSLLWLFCDVPCCDQLWHCCDCWLWHSPLWYLIVTFSVCGCNILCCDILCYDCWIVCCGCNIFSCDILCYDCWIVTFSVVTDYDMTFVVVTWIVTFYLNIFHLLLWQKYM